MATGYLFRQPGHEVQFDPTLGRLTPDLLVTSPNQQRLIVEVWRRCLPHATDARNKQWAELARHSRRIRKPVALSLGSASQTVVEPRILAGNNSTAIRIPVNGVGPIDSGPIELRMTNAPPIFDQALSGVAWLEINDGAHAELHPYWPNPHAARR